MKQGGKSIIGLWKWTERAVYEEGDFVIKGENIYRVNSEVTEIDPDTDRGHGKYELYPGEKINTKEEYENIVNDSEMTKDQYVSSGALNSILKGIYFGLDSNGIIDATIDVDEESNIKVSSDISLSPATDILDKLLDAPGYNNGSIKVSKNLDSIKDLVGRPDENDIVPRNGAKWITCNRSEDPESPNRCRKCWECVRACKRLYKTFDNELVINNGPTSDIESISETESESFENAVNICPYGSLTYTTDSDIATTESARYEDAVVHGITPGRDLIIFGVKNQKYNVQEQTGSSSSWNLVNSTSSINENRLISIVMPKGIFGLPSNDARENIKSAVQRYLHLYRGLPNNRIVWYADPGLVLPIVPSSTSTVYSENNTKKIETKVSETYNMDVTDMRSICVLQWKPSEVIGNSDLIMAVQDLMGDIYRSLMWNENSSQQRDFEFDWKTLLGCSGTAAAQSVYKADGYLETTVSEYELVQGESYSSTSRKRSFSKRVCGYLDSIDLICKTVGGDNYDSCRISQSSITATESAAGADHDWNAAKTRRYPSKWTSKLHPVEGKDSLSDYPIMKYWDYWVTNENGDHDDQKNFYGRFWIDSDTCQKFYPIYYNLTSNIFCVKIPEECLKYTDTSSLSDEERATLLSEVTSILDSYGFSSHDSPGELTNIANSLVNGGGLDVESLYSMLNTYALCDYVFNLTFGRFENNAYIQGSSEFVSNVENRISQHPYYNKLDERESAIGSPGSWDVYSICTTLDEWRIFASNPSDYYLHGDSNIAWDTQGDEGPGLALLPRLIYSEWQTLSSQMNLESLELDENNNSNLLLVPRWASESENTPIASGLTYTIETENEREPFWDELNDRETFEANSNIDKSITYSYNYYNEHFFVSNPDTYAILKQYSYYGNGGDTLLRVQELIDPDYGEMFVRSTKQRDWKPCIMNLTNTARKLTRILSTLDNYRHGYNTQSIITNQTYGTSCFSSWKHNTGWSLSESRLSRNYCIKPNIDDEIYIVLVKDVDGKLHNITIVTSPNNQVGAVFNFTGGKLEVRYSGSQIYLICSYGTDIVDIYYGK